MKKHCKILTASLLLLSCGVSKRSVDAEQHVKVQDTRTEATAQKQASATTAEAAVHTLANEVQRRNLEVVTFDTSLPADSATGLPPVKQILRERWGSEAQQRQDSYTWQAAETLARIEQTANELRVEQNDSKFAQRREVKQGQFITPHLWMVVAAFAVGFLFFLIKKGRQ